MHLNEFIDFIKDVDPEPKVTYLNFVAIVEYLAEHHTLMTVLFTEYGDHRVVAIDGKLLEQIKVRS